jgi:hypothetical protein
MLLFIVNVNKIGSWIYYNQPVSVKELAIYAGASDRKAKALLVYLTTRLPLYEDDHSHLGLNLELPCAKNFRLLEPTEL